MLKYLTWMLAYAHAKISSGLIQLYAEGLNYKKVI